jgi:very-short-patch-repair endonuclease
MLEIKEIEKMYDEGKSVREIAKHFGTYPTKIARMLKKTGKELRSKEEAGKIAVEQGRIKPPMLGKKRTAEEKAVIGAARAKKWASMTESELESFREAARERWKAEPEETKAKRQQLAGEALRRASVEGSKAEKFLYEELTKSGYNVIMHKTGLVPGEKYEVDLYLPDLLVIIEVDGPQHFLPIFGEDSLQRAIKYDTIKNGTLIGKGFAIIRVKYLMKSSSDYSNKRMLKMILEELEKIKKSFPKKENRMIELELSND